MQFYYVLQFWFFNLNVEIISHNSDFFSENGEERSLNFEIKCPNNLLHFLFCSESRLPIHTIHIQIFHLF